MSIHIDKDYLLGLDTRELAKEALKVFEEEKKDYIQKKLAKNEDVNGHKMLLAVNKRKRVRFIANLCQARVFLPTEVLGKQNAIYGMGEKALKEAEQILADKKVDR